MEVLQVGLMLICVLAVSAIPVTAVVVMREHRRTVDGFTAHLQTLPVVVGGETSDVALRRLDLEEQRGGLESERIAAQSKQHEMEYRLRLGSAQLQRSKLAAVES